MTANVKSTQNVVEGVGRDSPTVVNEKGGKQSKVLYRFDLLDPGAMFEMTKVLKEGAEKYGDNNWRNIPVEDHLNHMLIHAYAYLAGDKSDEHLSHIMCRAMFAQAVELFDKDKNRCVDDEENSVKGQSPYEIEDYILQDRDDADEVLEKLTEGVNKYGSISVADYLDLLMVTSKFTDYSYGWTSDTFVNVRVVPVRGGYLIKLPPASSL